MRILPAAYAASLLFLATACEDKKPTPPAASTSAPAHAKSAPSAKPSAVASASAAPSASAEHDPFAPGVTIAPELDPNGWVKLVKPRPVTAKAGDKVWAAVLDAGGMAGLSTRLSVLEVVAVKGDTASLKDAHGNTYDNVSGGVIQPRGDLSKLKPGDLVTALNGANLMIAALVKNDAKAPRVKAWDEASGKVAEFDVDFIEPFTPGVAPLSWVVVPTEKGERRQVVFAVEGEKVWAADARGGFGFDKAKVKAWTPATAAKAGDAVLLASGGGIEKGKLKAVTPAQMGATVEVMREGKSVGVGAFLGDVAMP